jgi:hypothetical protein
MTRLRLVRIKKERSNGKSWDELLESLSIKLFGSS